MKIDALINRIVKNLQITRWPEIVLLWRNRHLFLLDLIIMLLAPAIALTLRLENLEWITQLGWAFAFYVALSMAVKLMIFQLLRLYRRYWHYASVSDLLLLGMAVAASTFILFGLIVALHPWLTTYQLAMYRSVPLIDGLLTGIGVVGTRFSLRSLHHLRQQQQIVGGRRTLVIGAGEAGKMVVREMRGNPRLEMEPVAFVDDDPQKIGSHIYGLPVVGICNKIPRWVTEFRVQRIVIAMPSAPLGRQRELAALSRSTGALSHTLPGMYQLLAGYKTVSPLPRFDVHQLLRRNPIEIDRGEVSTQLTDTVVLVTGAGGSIGSELCRQIARCRPRKIVLLGHGENSIFEIALDLKLSFPNLVTHPVIVDVRDAAGVNRVVRQYQPQVIFHAAAHKHVPFMESHVAEAITNNVVGTQNVLKAAEQHGVPRLVMISTDKAVNPSSIMGATKRMAELLVMAAAQRSGQAYMAVRFGNVLGSRGSVLRVFQRQIANGGPLTITHPEMRRYFMTIPEAVQLVLQAGVLGQGGEAFVLDMGQPVRILDMATDLIRLAGLEPGRDIDIVFSGIRPGEKLSEELFLAAEAYQRTVHPQIFVTQKTDQHQPQALELVVKELVELAHRLHLDDSGEQTAIVLTKICYYLDKYQPQQRPPAPHLTLLKKHGSRPVTSQSQSQFRRPTTTAAS